jgi:pyruvate/2-oxoglutarate/acetoin dehydrogenase E1 component
MAVVDPATIGVGGGASIAGIRSIAAIVIDRNWRPGSRQIANARAQIDSRRHGHSARQLPPGP